MARIAVAGVLRDLVHGHALRNVAVPAHDELGGDEVSVLGPVAHDALGLAVALRVVQDDVLLVLDALGPMAEFSMHDLRDVETREQLV